MGLIFLGQSGGRSFIPTSEHQTQLLAHDKTFSFFIQTNKNRFRFCTRTMTKLVSDSQNSLRYSLHLTLTVSWDVAHLRRSVFIRVICNVSHKIYLQPFPVVEFFALFVEMFIKKNYSNQYLF